MGCSEIILKVTKMLENDMGGWRWGKKSKNTCKTQETWTTDPYRTAGGGPRLQKEDILDVQEWKASSSGSKTRAYLGQSSSLCMKSEETVKILNECFRFLCAKEMESYLYLHSG